MENESSKAFDIPRRAWIRGVTATGVAVVAGYVVGRNSHAATRGSASEAANGYGPEPPSGGRPLARLDDVPRGGGLVVRDANIVLTRDDAGQVRAFSATCTHQGCTVSSVQDGVIVCPCHGSRFDARNGRPVAGPASRPLAEVPVAVRNDTVVTT
ncbi:MAG: Rieske (2Fe-2S) protein [Actinomycetes bacterium]